MDDHICALESYIRKWTWEYRIDQHYRVYFDYDDLDFDVDLTNVHFTFDKPNFSNYRKSPMSIAKVVLTSNYTNNTYEPQEINIRTKRTTSATARATVKHGFTADYGVGLKLRLPNDVVGSFDGDAAVDTDDNEKLEHTMTWSFNTKITAAPRRTTVAKFSVNEERLSCDFSTYVHLKGVAVVKVRVKNTKQPLVTVKEDIKTIIDECLPRADESSPKENIVYLETQSVKWPFRGNLDFHYGISQNEVIE